MISTGFSFDLKGLQATEGFPQSAKEGTVSRKKKIFLVLFP